MFGCRPGDGVKLRTNMVYELASILLSRYERENFTITIPDVFERLKSEDATFEMVESNTRKKLRLFYGDNVVTHRKALIFWNNGISRSNINDNELIELAARMLYPEGAITEDNRKYAKS